MEKANRADHERKNRLKSTLRSGLVNSCLLIFLQLCSGCGSGNSQARDMLARFQSFPFHFNLPDPDGRMVSLSDYKGKVVIVDFWGTWCPPCRMEVPHFIDLYKKYHGSGLEIVGINYEKVRGNQARDLVRNFVAENGVPYRCVMGDLQTHKMVPGLQAYPTTLFIDRSGKVRLLLEGYTPEEELEAIVKELLEERA